MRINLSFKYALSISIVLLVVLGTITQVISKKHEQLLIAQIEMQAKALFQQIVITRRWIADHGGVYVERLPWTKPNPFLANPTIKDVQGKRYIKENPAMVTKQLSRYAQREGLYVFHITSLKLMNPDNAPDEFETRALTAFGEGSVKESKEISRIGNARYYRYMAPLYVEETCLKCHARQGYKVGDVRGGISVSLPVEDLLATVNAERGLMFGGAVLVAAFIMLALYLVTRRLVIEPVNVMRSHMARFSRDNSVELPLQRTGDEIEDLSRSFVDMAGRLREYHACLREKIDAATLELKEKNEALAAASRSKSDFIAKTSHELRTPLTAIKGAMDYLSVKLEMREVGRNDDLIIFFEMTKKNADRLIRLVNNILEYERIGLGSLEMHFRPVNLRTCFEEVITGFTLLAQEKNVEVTLQGPQLIVNADEDRIKQTLTNLLSNALNFAPSHSIVAVEIASENGAVIVSVSDRGRGIPEEERENIFRQFYTKDTKGGTGLGLAICKGIIEAHGGEIGVTPVPGGGSRFWFRLPVSGKEETVREQATACD